MSLAWRFNIFYRSRDWELICHKAFILTGNTWTILWPNTAMCWSCHLPCYFDVSRESVWGHEKVDQLRFCRVTDSWQMRRILFLIVVVINSLIESTICTFSKSSSAHHTSRHMAPPGVRTGSEPESGTWCHVTCGTTMAPSWCHMVTYGEWLLLTVKCQQRPVNKKLPGSQEPSTALQRGLVYLALSA